VGQLSTGSESIAEQIAEIDEQIADAGQVAVLGPLVDADDVLTAWEALDLQRKRAVVRTLVSVVVHRAGKGARTFDPSTVTVTWRR